MNNKPFILAACIVLAFTCLICGGVVIFLFTTTYNKTAITPGGKACTLEAKVCPDGTSVGRNPDKNCEFDECSQSVTACTDDAKLCPDGSYVGRKAPSCEFEECPVDVGKVCTQDIKICPDGSYVSRDPSKNCEFNACN